MLATVVRASQAQKCGVTVVMTTMVLCAIRSTSFPLPYTITRFTQYTPLESTGLSPCLSTCASPYHKVPSQRPFSNKMPPPKDHYRRECEEVGGEEEQEIYILRARDAVPPVLRKFTTPESSQSGRHQDSNRESRGMSSGTSRRARRTGKTDETRGTKESPDPRKRGSTRKSREHPVDSGISDSATSEDDSDSSYDSEELNRPDHEQDYGGSNQPAGHTFSACGTRPDAWVKNVVYKSGPVQAQTDPLHFRTPDGWHTPHLGHKPPYNGQPAENMYHQQWAENYRQFLLYSWHFQGVPPHYAAHPPNAQQQTYGSNSHFEETTPHPKWGEKGQNKKNERSEPNLQFENPPIIQFLPTTTLERKFLFGSEIGYYNDSKDLPKYKDYMQLWVIPKFRRYRYTTKGSDCVAAGSYGILDLRYALSPNEDTSSAVRELLNFLERCLGDYKAEKTSGCKRDEDEYWKRQALLGGSDCQRQEYMKKYGCTLNRKP